jgi:hypothetical protein
MRSVGSRLLIGALSVTATLFAVGPSALASKPGGSGGGTVQLGPPTLISETMTGKVVIEEQQGSLTFTGTIVGTGTLDVIARISPAGKETLKAEWTAPVTVDGTSGVLDLTPVRGRDDGIMFSGTFVARGSGGLAGLVGQGKFSGQDATGAGTYTFHYNL